MVHFYRAAPQPKSQTETYVMYGLLAVAVLLGLFYLYKRNQKKLNNDSRETPESSMAPMTPMASMAPMTPMASMAPMASIKLAGTSWKRYVSPDYGGPLTESNYDFLVFDAQKGVTVKTGDFDKRKLVPELAVIYSDDGNMRGRLDNKESPNTVMTYRFEVDKDYGNLLVITTSDNKVYKLIKTSEPTAPDTA